MPITGSAAIDIDGDGTKELFINNGDKTFTNETVARGVNFLHNTFQSAFSAFEGDGDLDLFSRRTCPRSASSWPLCYTSLMVGVGLRIGFFMADLMDRKYVKSAASFDVPQSFAPN